MDNSEDPKEQNDPERERHEAADNAYRNKVISALQAIAEQNKAAEDQAKRADRFHRAVERLTLRLEGRKYWVEIAETAGLWVAAAVGVIAVIVATRDASEQRNVMQGQLEEMRSSAVQSRQLVGANARLVESAGKQADAAQKQAQALADSATTAHDNMILAERAWVGPTNASFGTEPAIGKPIEITVTYQNSGRQPALNFLPLMDAFAVSDQEDKAGVTDQRTRAGIQNCINTKQWAGGSVAFPSTGFSNFSFFTKTKDDFVDDTILKGTKTVVVQGCFLYRTFDAPHHSYFCFFYKGGGVTRIQNLNICSGGHAAD